MENSPAKSPAKRDRPEPGKVYNLFGGEPGKPFWQSREIQSDSLPLGARVSYEDRANAKQLAVVVEASGDSYGQRCIFVEDFHESHVSLSCILGPGGWEREEGIADAVEIAALIAGVLPAREKADRERSEAADRHAAEVSATIERLQKKYPWARPMGKGSEPARAAANLRKELALTFPGIKFSVTSDSFSGGDSIDYRWDLGPTSKEVAAIADKYQEGSFNGMEDIYENDMSAFSSAVSKVLGQVKYCHGSRGESENHAIVARALCDEFKLERPADGKSFWNICVPNENGPREDMGGLARQIIMQQSYPPGAILTGLERVEGITCGRASEFWRATFSVPEVLEKKEPERESLPRPVNAAGADCVTVSENEEKNGVEIRFPSIPPAEIRSALKSKGFRWSRHGGCWYHRRNVESLAFARTLQSEETPAVPGERFECGCGGAIIVESEERVLHTCRAPSQSYGMDNKPIPYVRGKNNTGAFYWRVDWQHSPKA